MSRKVTGCVIASDGTVQTYFGTELLLKTIGDDTFIWYRDDINQGSTRRNYGWIMYKNGSRKKIIGLTNAKYSLARILCEAGI